MGDAWNRTSYGRIAVPTDLSWAGVECTVDLIHQQYLLKKEIHLFSFSRFCRKHSSAINIDGTSTSSDSGCKQPPADLLRVAERIMPRLLLRLVQYLRENR